MVRSLLGENAWIFLELDYTADYRRSEKNKQKTTPKWFLIPLGSASLVLGKCPSVLKYDEQFIHGWIPMPSIREIYQEQEDYQSTCAVLDNYQCYKQSPSKFYISLPMPPFIPPWESQKPNYMSRGENVLGFSRHLGGETLKHGIN